MGLSYYQPIQELNDARFQAIRAVVSGRYAHARKQATLAMLIIATIPDGELAGSTTVTWDRKAIQAFLEELDRLEAAENPPDNGGMVLQSYSYSGRRSGCD